MYISEAGIDVLIEREGCVLTAYQDSVGVWTIGVGHTSAAGPPEVKPGLTLTEEEAAELLDRDLDAYENCVNDCIEVALTQNEFDALTSICFNIGQGAFKDSTFVERINANESPQEIAEAIAMWDKPPEIVPRRNGEIVQFLGGYLPRVKAIE